MGVSTLTAGDPIEARCTKCRKNTNHIIVAMKDDVPAKVECNTCSGQHKYRPPTAPKKPATRRTVDPKVAERKEWAELSPEMNKDQATAYSMDTAYKVGALINHSAFGLGITQRVVGPRKIEVLFESGKKIMRCK
jgi:hypothetical protein